MTRESDELLQLKGRISDLTYRQRAEIAEAKVIIAGMVTARPHTTLMALALVALDAHVNPRNYGMLG